MAIVISGVNNNDKITAADGTIDLLSGVSYSGIITAPAFTSTGNITASGNVSGVNITSSNNLTAASINVGSGIQLGNAGVATATTFVGNLTGNVNATSNLLLQIGGSEKFRVGSSGQLGIGGANYGTSGQVLTSGGSGSAATWSTVSGTTINNNAGNKVITGSSTANTLEAEDTLRYDGTNFLIGTNTEAPYSNRNLTVAAGGSGSTTTAIEIRSATNGTGRVIFSDGTSADSSANEGQVIYQQSDHKMLFGVAANYQNMALESTGGTGADLNLIDGNLKFASGHGIDFSSQSTSQQINSPTTDDEVLQYYEKGKWTPDVRKNGVSNATASVLHGRYVRIGQMVWISMYARWASGSNSQGTSGSWEIYGLPYSLQDDNPGTCRIYQFAPAGYFYINSTYYGNTHVNRWQVNNNTKFSLYTSLSSSQLSWNSGAMGFSLTGCFMIHE